jgi:hypothetical protein
MDVYRAWVNMMLKQRKEFLQGLHVADEICNQIPVCME